MMTHASMVQWFLAVELQPQHGLDAAPKEQTVWSAALARANWLAAQHAWDAVLATVHDFRALTQGKKIGNLLGKEWLELELLALLRLERQQEALETALRRVGPACPHLHPALPCPRAWP